MRACIGAVEGDNIIEISDELDALLMELCRMTRMGRARVIEVALNVLVDQWGANAQQVEAVISKIRDARTFPQIGKDALEVAKLPPARA
jgi:predicted transcriptional regulator